MAFEVAKRPIHQTFPKRKPEKSKDYVAFLHELPCIITGKYGVQAAHLSYSATQYGHYGRGKQTKASDRWALPLCPEEHNRQHNMNEAEFWRQAGINPHIVALTIWGMFTEYGMDAVPFATAIINQGLVGRSGYQEIAE